MLTKLTKLTKTLYTIIIYISQELVRLVKYLFFYLFSCFFQFMLVKFQALLTLFIILTNGLTNTKSHYYCWFSQNSQVSQGFVERYIKWCQS